MAGILLGVVALAAVAKGEARRTRPGGDKLRVLILGDSLVATGFGNQLKRFLERHPGLECRVRSRSATGLARPDAYDWPEKAGREVKEVDPQVVLVLMGCNDGQDILLPRRAGAGKGGRRGRRPPRRIIWGHKEWQKAYREQAEAFLSRIAGPGRRVLWVSLPVPRSRSLESKLALIRRLQKQVVQRRKGWVLHLDGPAVLTHARPKGRRFAVRRPRKLHKRDGVHFSARGNRYFIHMIYPTLLPLLAGARVDLALESKHGDGSKKGEPAHRPAPRAVSRGDRPRAGGADRAHGVR